MPVRVSCHRHMNLDPLVSIVMRSAVFAGFVIDIAFEDGSIGQLEPGIRHPVGKDALIGCHT